MALQPFRDKELNYFKFASIALNEFPKALRQTFKSMWDNTFGHRPGYHQLWDDSTAVRNKFSTEEGGATKVPTHLSFEEWDCTALFQATIYAKSFALPDSRGHNKTLGELYVKPRKLAHGTFHASVVSPSGNNAETFALAIDQLRLLRNSLCHSHTSEIDKPTFDQYVQHAKDAFTALGVTTDPIDIIGGLSESDFPTNKVQELEKRMKEETRAYLGFLEGIVGSGIDDIKLQVFQVIATAEHVAEATATKEDIALLRREINDLKLTVVEGEQGKGLNLTNTISVFDDYHSLFYRIYSIKRPTSNKRPPRISG